MGITTGAIVLFRGVCGKCEGTCSGVGPDCFPPALLLDLLPVLLLLAAILEGCVAEKDPRFLTLVGSRERLY